jgi:hypothetical protein
LRIHCGARSNSTSGSASVVSHLLERGTAHGSQSRTRHAAARGHTNLVIRSGGRSGFDPVRTDERRPAFSYQRGHRGQHCRTLDRDPQLDGPPGLAAVRSRNLDLFKLSANGRSTSYVVHGTAASRRQESEEMRLASLPLPHDAIYLPTEMRFSTALTPAAAHVACSAARRSAAERTSPVSVTA